MTAKVNRIIFPILFLLITSGTSAQVSIRPLMELTADTSGWAIVKDAVKSAKNKVEILPIITRKTASDALLHTQVTTRSFMGAVVYFTGGILIDNGWIRILGSGNAKLTRTLPDWNKAKTYSNYGDRPAYLLIGDDVIGGFFAVNGGALGPDLGKVYYLAPETLQWESLNKGYSDFLDFCFNGDLNKFYKGYKINELQKDIAKVSGDAILNFYPYLWTTEGRDLKKTSRKILPVEEQFIFNIDAMKQIKK